MTESITVESLSKRYELGALQQETQLRDQLVRLLRAPFGKRAPKEVIWALRDVSFTVQQGEVVGIIGRNGAGKSTLLKILSKITYPTSGRVRARGRVAALLEVGAGFHEELTGRENIFLNGSIMGMKKKEVDAKLEAIVEFSGLQRFVDTPIKRYSTGMRSRLGFAVAAHLDPDVLIVDEVLAVGDAVFQKKCVSAMHDLRGGGRTVLFVSTTWRRSRIYARAACGSQRAESSSTDRCVRSSKPTWDRLLRPKAPPGHSSRQTAGAGAARSASPGSNSARPMGSCKPSRVAARVW